MFNDILVAADPDETDSSVPSYGFTLAEATGGRLHIFMVIDEPQQRDQLRADHESEVRESVDSLVTKARERNIEVDGHVTTGMPAEEIVEAIDEIGVDAVVMGTKARSGLDKLVLGSVAESVIEESPVPVLTVPPAATPPAESHSVP